MPVSPAVYFAALHDRLATLYACECEDCAALAAGEGEGPDADPVMAAADAAFKHLHDRGQYQPKDLGTEQPYKDLIDATRKAFDPAIRDGQVPDAMARYLAKDNHVFSGLKTHAQLLEASRLLTASDGSRRPYHEFEQDVLKLNEAYNRNYLKSEYQFATQSAIMAGKWAGFMENADRYDGQYRTAKDNHVRDSHRVLDEITLPWENIFWSYYYPPNGWKCRCTAQEVRKGKYAVSDADEAIANGEKATTQIGKGGKNTLEMFRFNPGKDEKLFPPSNPYTKVAGAGQAAAVVKKEAAKGDTINIGDFIKKDTVSNKHVSDILHAYAEKFPEDFRNGLDTVRFSASKSYLMEHSMKYSSITKQWAGGSSIAISTSSFRVTRETVFNPAAELKGALLTIRDGKQLSFNQEYAMEALWHEMLHAKTKSPPVKLSSDQTRAMETVNQFCARHTYDTFIERLGGKAAHQEAILKDGYGYHGWVKEFRAKLDELKIDEKTAVNDLMPALMKDYPGMRKKLDKYLKP